MSRVSVLNSPFLLGFDRFERTLERVASASADAYPPYNIEAVGEERLRITLAVAGFTSDDLDVTIEDNQLTVRGKQQDENSRVYLHRGIAARQFQRSFLLAEGIEVKDALLNDGLLNIELRRPLPERNVRSVEIKSGGPTSRRPQAIDLEPQPVALTKGARS